MIEVDLHLTVGDARRRFTLSMAFESDASVLALYGPSGSGKSLTLSAMAGLIRPERGRVCVAGRTLFDSDAGIDLPTRERSLGYLFQSYALFPHLNVRDNIGFALQPWWRRGLDANGRRRVEELLELFQLAALAESRPAALSGGQQQRVALARALACEPNALLLDEPFAALNPMLRSGLREELAALRSRLKIPVVMITHDIDDLAALAEQVVVIDHGRVVREIDLSDGATRLPALRALQPESLAPHQLARRRVLSKAFAQPWNEGMPS
ncbi:MAG: ATP-binding cassette domain-containing protein [Burkholderiales bacterium]|nr:ATP-binding cassette domain-containing protein [Burkholderiales bacterium]